MAVRGGSGRREPELRGREAEVADLAGWISRLRAGHGGVLLIEGGPGTGRSRLAREARAMARDHPIRVLAGAGRREGRGVPFGALLQALCPEDRPVVDVGILRTLSESAEQRFWLFQALQDQLGRAALDQPLLVVIDDLQWCDAGTLLALRTLPARLSAHAILWLVTVRTGSPDSDVRAAVTCLAGIGAGTMRLGPLPDEAVAGICGDLLGAEPGGDVLDLLRQAEGRPLLVTEIVGGLLREDTITCANGVAQLTGRPSPTHFHGSARRLLDQLSPLTGEVVRLAAVLGRGLEADRLADLGGHTIAEVVAALQEAVDAGLVGSTDPLTFRHDVLREAIRATVPAPRRRELRARAAELSLARGVPIAQVALDLAETAEPGDGDTVALLREALAELSRTSPAAAVPVARRLVALAPAGSAERAEAVADVLPLLTRAGRGGEGRLLAELVLVDGPLPAVVEARLRLEAAMAATRGAFAEVLRHSRAGSALRGVPDRLRAPLMALRCLATLLTGDAGAAERLLPPAAEAASRAGTGPALALLRTAESLARALRLDFTAAERLADAAVSAVPDPSAVFFPAVWRAALHGMTGQVEKGLRETAEGLAAARRPGHAQGRDVWLTVRARLLLAAGRPAEARIVAEAALATTEESGAGDAVTFAALSVIGRAAALTGDPVALSRAAGHADRILTTETGPARRAYAWLEAWLADATGDRDRAHALLGEAATASETPTAPGGFGEAADDLMWVRMALRAGLGGRAAAAVAGAERRAALNPGVPFFAAVAAHARGLLNDDVEAVRQAVLILRRLPCPLALASALEDAGRLALKAGRAVSAVSPPGEDNAAAVAWLTEAATIYSRAGARNEAARVRRRLGAAERRWRAEPARATRGWDALTPAERRVASLVAKGATNRQAAEKLFLSPATVGTHVMHVFHKLGVNSRVELARAYVVRAAGTG
jgi:DNA-binding CsgD family transcriptional regulator